MEQQEKEKKHKRPKNLIRVFEHQSITIKGGKYHKSGFDEPLLQAFQLYHQQNDNTPFFELINKGVRFKSYVGAIRVGKTTIEVLPKADKEKTNEKDWQSILIDMLKTCHLLTAKQSGEANLKLKANSILELYFEMFVNEVEQLMHHGLIKKYRKAEGNRNALKGALVFSKHITKNIVHKERFYVSYTDYNKKHLLHQVLYEALLLIQQLNSSIFLSDRIERIILDFPELYRLKVNEKTFNRIVITRKTEPYQLALHIAELLLLNYRPDIRSGSRNLLAIMFDMNKLWEEYVYRILRKHNKEGYTVEAQNSKVFWKKITTRPDVVIKSERSTYIIDTKWKLVDSNKPSIDDLRQIFAYNHLWKSTRSILLYPGIGIEEDKSFTNYAKSAFEEEAVLHGCKVGYIDVLKYHKEIDGKRNFANEIFRKLEGLN